MTLSPVQEAHRRGTPYWAIEAAKYEGMRQAIDMLVQAANAQAGNAERIGSPHLPRITVIETDAV